MRPRTALVLGTLASMIVLGMVVGLVVHERSATTTQVAPSASASAGPPAAPSRVSNPTSATPTSPPLPVGLLGRDIDAVPTSIPVVALTFDAGANADGLRSILATLAARHLPATFFLTGDFAGRDPAAVRDHHTGPPAR
jgi:peptidoglycan-N-acetylglucosamine deacetylase